MTDRADTVFEAMKRGISRAGFANVRGEILREAIPCVLRVKADCPCGMGVSGFQYAMMAWPSDHEASFVENRYYHMGLQHIEDDRAEGRWVS